MNTSKTVSLDENLPAKRAADDEPADAEYLKGAVGRSMLTMGGLCAVLGFVGSFFADTAAVGNPFIGMSGMLAFGLLLSAFGAGMIMTADRRQ